MAVSGQRKCIDHRSIHIYFDAYGKKHSMQYKANYLNQIIAYVHESDHVEIFDEDYHSQNHTADPEEEYFLRQLEERKNYW